MSHPDFENILTPYKRIKQERADEQLNFYIERVNLKHLFAQWSGAVILIISLSIPIVTNFGINVFSSQILLNIIISSLSLIIALLSGFEGLFQWRTTWKEYSKAIVRLKTLIALWEIKVANARELHDNDEVSKALGDATEELIGRVEEVTSAEMNTFFSARLAVRQASGAETTDNGS